MGERSLRRLLIIGASAVARWAARKGVPAGSWLGRMLARKPPMLVRVALANKMARIVWALLAKGGVYRAPVAELHDASTHVVMPGISHGDVPCPPREHGRIRRLGPQPECGSAATLTVLHLTTNASAMLGECFLRL